MTAKKKAKVKRWTRGGVTVTLRDLPPLTAEQQSRLEDPAHENAADYYALISAGEKPGAWTKKKHPELFEAHINELNAPTPVAINPAKLIVLLRHRVIRMQLARHKMENDLRSAREQLDGFARMLVAHGLHGQRTWDPVMIGVIDQALRKVAGQKDAVAHAAAVDKENAERIARIERLVSHLCDNASRDGGVDAVEKLLRRLMRDEDD